MLDVGEVEGRAIAAVPTLVHLAGAGVGVPVGTCLVLEARVQPLGAGADGLTGSVTFRDGAQELGAVTVGGDGLAVLTDVTLPIGFHVLTAVYTGDDRFQPASSVPVPQPVLAPRQPVQVAVAATRTVGGGLSLDVALREPAGRGLLEHAAGELVLDDAEGELARVPLRGGRVTVVLPARLRGPLQVRYDGDAEHEAGTALVPDDTPDRG